MADKKISALAAAAALTGVEQVPVVQNGATVRTTVAGLSNALNGTYARLSALSRSARYDGGCVLNGTADDTAALQALLNSLATTGGEVILDGVAGISAQVVIPDRVWLRAYSVQKTGNNGGGLIALAGFPINTALVRIGSGSAAVFNCGIRDLDVHCNSIAGSWAVYSNSINEGAGVIGCQLRHYRAGAIDVLGGSGLAEDFIIRDNHAFCSASATGSIGIRVANCQAKNDIDNNTVGVSAGAVDQDAAVLITGPGSATDGFGYVTRLHVENHTSGVRFGSGGQGVAQDIDGRNCSTAAVEIASGGGRVVVANARRTGTTTVTVLDSTLAGARSIANTPVPIYATAGVASLANNLVVLGDGTNDMAQFIDENGVLRVRLDPAGRIQARGGDATGPSISFQVGQSYGFYYIGSPAAMGIAAGGVEVARVTAAGITIPAGKVLLGGDPDDRASGEATMKRRYVSATTVATSTGVLRLAYFTAKKTETIANLRLISGGTAAGATPTLVRAGVYSVDGSGNITLIGSIANDTAIFATGSTVYDRALSASFTKTEGVRYAVGILVVTAFTAPTVTGQNALNSAEALAGPTIGGAVTGQADLPGSVVVGSIITNGNIPYVVLLP